MNLKYPRQLDYIFNRPTDEPAWYWRTDHWEDSVFDDSSLDAFLFFENLFSNVKKDLEPYSDDQIGLGLNYIFNNSCSNFTQDFKDAKVPFEHKIKVLKGLNALFQYVFNERCTPTHAAFSQAELSKLNYICYMFWDITPLSIWASLDEKEVEIYNATIANIMKNCLILSNPVCIESGLHGLGHLAFSFPNIAVPIIDDFLKNGKCRHENIIQYAKMARTGMIQ